MAWHFEQAGEHVLDAHSSLRELAIDAGLTPNGRMVEIYGGMVEIRNIGCLR